MKSRNSGLKIVFLLLTQLLLTACSGQATEARQPVWQEEPANADTRPDIILVVADDMRWDLMGSRGHEFLQTPHLDALASDGTMMLNAFVPVAVCAQSRAAILTGRDVHKASAPILVWKNNSFLQTQKTFPHYLQDAGYTTAFLGKWHLGEGSQPKPGFDHWESFDWLGDFHDPVIHRNGVAIEHEGYVDDILTRRAHELLYEHRQPGKPMFIMVSLKAPHLQFEHPERHAHALEQAEIPRPDTYNEDFSQSGKPQGILDWLGIETNPCGLKCFSNSWNKFIKYHFRAVMGVDDQVGVLRDAIAAGRKADNTLFLFTSDNGYSLGDHGLSAKHFVYEEPVRVPFLVDAPGNLDVGRQPDQLVSTIDIAPTILDYADVPIPDTMTGQSIRPLLQASPASGSFAWRDSLFLMYEKERTTVPTQIAVRTANHKLIRSVTEDDQSVIEHYELYDLQTDPRETVNRFEQPAYATVRENMMAELESLLEQNQWSARKRQEVGHLLVSSPVPTAGASSLAQAYSAQVIEAGESSTGSGESVSWRRLASTAGEFDLLPGQDGPGGRSVMVALTIERLVDWDPFVQVLLDQRHHATVYHDGLEIFSTRRPRQLGEVINPALQDRLEQVVIVFDDSAAMRVQLAIKVAERTVRLPLENRESGNALTGL